MRETTWSKTGNVWSDDFRILVKDKSREEWNFFFSILFPNGILPNKKWDRRVERPIM